MAIVEGNPHLLDIVAQGLGRNLELLVAERLQISPVGWVVPEGRADDDTITCTGLVWIQQGVSA